MIRSPTYIHFRSQWQMLRQDAPGQFFDKKRFQELMSSLNEGPNGADFDDFSYRADRCEMGKIRDTSAKDGQAFSKLTYNNDQLTLIEEWADISANEFKERSINVITAWFKVFPNTAIIAQSCCIRALIQPVNSMDSRQFLGDKVLRIGEPMKKVFRDMPFRVGFNVTWMRRMPDYQIAIDATVNSWRDNVTVWVQVNGSSPMATPINATNPEKAMNPFEDCENFLETEVCQFLNQFDTTGQEGVDKGGLK